MYLYFYRDQKNLLAYDNGGCLRNEDFAPLGDVVSTDLV